MGLWCRASGYSSFWTPPLARELPYAAGMALKRPSPLKKNLLTLGIQAGNYLELNSSWLPLHSVSLVPTTLYGPPDAEVEGHIRIIIMFGLFLHLSLLITYINYPDS